MIYLGMGNRKRNRRRSVRADGPPQMGLFDEPTRKAAVQVGGITFVKPDPRDIYVGAERLDRFLKDTGQTWVFLVRELLDSRDWTQFEATYAPKGRRPYHPTLIVGLVLLGAMEGVSSLRQLEARARRDVAWWWVTGGIMPDHSVIGRFLQTFDELLTDALFEDLTRGILKATGSQASSVAVDGTVILAASSRYSALKAEAAQMAAKEARAEADESPDEEDLQKRAEHAEHVASVAQERVAKRRAKGTKNPDAPVVNPTEPDAVIQKQKDHTTAPSYKPSVLANDDRIIVAHGVDPSSETAVVEPMLEQTARVTGSTPEHVMADAGYFCSQLITLALALDIDLLCPHGKSRGDGAWEKKSKLLPKSAFTYDEARNVYICPQGRDLVLNWSTHDDAGRAYSRYRSKNCSACPQRAQCTRGKSGRSIRRYADEEAREALKEVMRQPGARKRYRHRKAMVEPVFGSMRQRGFRRFSRYGLAGARLEFAIQTMAHNLGRAIALRRTQAAAWAANRAWWFPRMLHHIWSTISVWQRPQRCLRLAA